MSLKNKINPFSIVLLYILVHVLFTVLYVCIAPDSGGSSFEFVAKSINALPDCILAVTVVSSFIFREWVKRHWIITTILVLIGLSGLIVYVVRKYIYHWDGPYW